ncbi:transglutaminase domain-containing protein [Winogradskyella immobilis]|uniref:Transglutaminase-like domain-containing protein n=1 Tax=Winogradskyella immobilis TaxID=2816852 RepID=A0ABS8EIT8_9FLAO|nr:transglutaminase domain-containing protein [Winogradskyella immobilis]MCC1483123.1 hypothetical protein [Winogradskyella immobilis]MCG0015218.1 hypothetical protein [Winogradskyella immobilis]
MKNVLHILLFLIALQTDAQISDFKSIDFKKADLNALECDIKSLDNLPKLVEQLTLNLTTDVERFRAIYMWVSTNIANDYSLYNKNMYNRRRFKDKAQKLESWNKRFNKTLFNTLTEDKKTICTGYAYIIRELAKVANLDCRIVNGYGKVSTTIDQLDTPNHSWNVVKLNGKWYFCDATWASGIPDPETNFFTFNFNSGYFLTDPKLFAISHYPIDKKWLLLEDTDYSFEEFTESPLIYNNAYKHLQVHILPEKMHNIILKNQKIVFDYVLKSSLSANDVHFLIDDGFGSLKTKPTSISIKEQQLTLEHIFERTGFYDVHLYIKDDLISTYTFKVKSKI